jgi:SIR2-like domain
MIWNSGTVFVLGAGFTKAFLPKAPLLIDDYGGDDLKRKFASFPEPLALLEMELNHPDHRPGWINLERLMTRLVGGMPYDLRTGAEKPLAMLLAAIKQSFIQRLVNAKSGESPFQADLWLFAGHCITHGITCLTFNYDDLLDEALSSYCYERDYHDVWPDWGYGFPCRPSESLRGEVPLRPGAPGAVRLIKLHGSINWRIPYGHQEPYGADAVRHHERWSRRLIYPRAALEELEIMLEPEPFMVPPVLTKADLVEQPILRTMWLLAIQALKKAQRVVFLGYSLPLTDIAAGFLFREGLTHLEHRNAITVIDFARDDHETKEKLQRLRASYGNVFPSIEREQFDFSGAADWVRNNLTEWFYDSLGNPVAYSALGHIVSVAGRFIGTVRGYHGGQDVWHGPYKGEIVAGNRFLRLHTAPTNDRGGGRPPLLPGVPSIPNKIAPMSLPAGYRDIDWNDETWLYAKPEGLHDTTGG